MRTEQALREFIASRIAANLSPATIEWYKDRLLPFAKSYPTLPRRPEPIECFLANVQGSQFTSGTFTGLLEQHGVKVSMDGKGGYNDNLFIERLWRSVKYEEVW